MKLLNWQEKAKTKFKDLRKLKQKDYVLIAGTGCGKTTAAVACVQSELTVDPNTLIMVFCPSRAIKRGWARTFKKFKIPCASRPQDVAPDRPAIISTYAGAKQMLSNVKNYLVRRNVMFVFDEFHHLEECNEWAAPFIDMEEHEYSARIFLSGTPWHESGDLCLVEYIDKEFEVDGKKVVEKVVKHDFMYTYGENVNDITGDRNTVSIKFFPRAVGVEIDVYDKDSGVLVGTETKHSEKTTRSDSISPFVRFAGADPYQCLETLEDKKGKHIRGMIDDGVKALINKRKVMTSAAGIVFVSSRNEGEAVRMYMKKAHHIDAVFVVSDDPESHRSIEMFEQFGEYGNEWIIAIDMIAEGADIPRLKVAVDLSFKTTMMHIIQRWGRVLRILRSSGNTPICPDIEAEIFFVNHAQLKYVAELIEADLHRYKRDGNGGGEGEIPPSQFDRRVKSSSDEIRDTIYKGENIEIEISELASWLINTNYNGDGQQMDFKSAVWVAKSMLNDNRIPDAFNHRMPEEDRHVERNENGSEFDHEEEVSKTKSRLKRTIGVIANLLGGDYSAANVAINKRQRIGSWTQNGKTLEELRYRADIAESVRNSLVEGDYDE